MRTFNRLSGKPRWIFDVAFTVLALRLDVRGFRHGRAGFNHKAACAVKRGEMLNDIGAESLAVGCPECGTSFG